MNLNFLEDIMADNKKAVVDSFVPPNFGDKKNIIRRVMGCYGEQNQENTLTFLDITQQLKPEQVVCMCGYDYSQGMWFGSGCTMLGNGMPHSFQIVLCPKCNLEHIGCDSWKVDWTF